ncbi:type II secretion system protein [Candidatus Parcubacteria bacterium]|nr:type II secretion system protein [Candidatus Parcubacteria bacterium]
MKYHHAFPQTGFTLIEMIVALAVFSVVVTMSMGALLTLVGTNQQLQAEQSVMTNLSFALDSMTREIRTGIRYYCGGTANRNGSVSGYQLFRDNQDLNGMDEETRDCSDGRDTSPIQGVAFIEGGKSVTGVEGTRIVYFFDEGEHKLYRRVSNDEAQSIVSSGIYINNAEFYVTGSEPLEEGEETQAAVTIFIEAQDPDDVTGKLHQIQTTITQRTLDI